MDWSRGRRRYLKLSVIRVFLLIHTFQSSFGAAHISKLTLKRRKFAMELVDLV